MLFFFYRNGSNRALHSFPTRRSSDLCVSRWRRSSSGSEASSWFMSSFLTPQRLITARADRDRRPGAARVARSEEHTSELQSRRDLVCRLLLEKKKIIHSNKTRVLTPS